MSTNNILNFPERLSAAHDRFDGIANNLATTERQRQVIAGELACMIDGLRSLPPPDIRALREVVKTEIPQNDLQALQEIVRYLLED